MFAVMRETTTEKEYEALPNIFKLDLKGNLFNFNTGLFLNNCGSEKSSFCIKNTNGLSKFFRYVDIRYGIKLDNLKKFKREMKEFPIVVDLVINETCWGEKIPHISITSISESEYTLDTRVKYRNYVEMFKIYVGNDIYLDLYSTKSNILKFKIISCFFHIKRGAYVLLAEFRFNNTIRYYCYLTPDKYIRSIPSDEIEYIKTTELVDIEYGGEVVVYDVGETIYGNALVFRNIRFKNLNYDTNYGKELENFLSLIS